MGDNIEFHGLAPDPNDPDLSWHDHFMVMPIDSSDDSQRHCEVCHLDTGLCLVCQFLSLSVSKGVLHAMCQYRDRYRTAGLMNICRNEIKTHLRYKSWKECRLLSDFFSGQI